MSFTGKTALITGGAGALGGAVARAFAAAGANLVLPVRSEDQRGPVVSSFALPDARISVSAADLADERAVNRLVAEANAKFHSVDILVNCAGGYAGGKTIDEVTVDEWNSLITLNLTTTFLTCRAVLPLMKQRNFGRIVNIAAGSALSPGARRGPYQVSKRGVITLTETIAEETRGTGITANVIAPTIILTPANRASMPDADTSRWVPPERIAGMIIALCGDTGVSGNVVRM